MFVTNSRVCDESSRGERPHMTINFDQLNVRFMGGLSCNISRLSLVVKKLIYYNKSFFYDPKHYS